MAQPFFKVDGLETAYGQKQVLFGVSLWLNAGEVLGVIGRNGMGKTTTLRSILGLTKPKRGSVTLDGHELVGQSTSNIARAGIGYVPEGRQVFPNLSVREHLVMAFANRRAVQDPWNIDRVFDLFPKLASRQRHLGTQLSGGEQQMLAIGRALVTNPRLVILDEATEGLAPLMRREIWQCLETLKKQGQSAIIVDKNLSALLRVAERNVILEKGRTVWFGSSAELRGNDEIQTRYLAV